MSLTGALQIGSSALTASQLALQVAGNNLANAATPGYSRQVAYLSPSRTNTAGRISIGTGVRVTDVRRQMDIALQARLYTGISQEASALREHSIMAQIESSLGELGENDLSSELTRFFASWSERANLTQSSAVVVQQGQRLADFTRRLRTDLTDQRAQIDRQLEAMAQNADGLLTQIAGLNRAVAEAEAGGGRANALRDQRDTLIAELSRHMDVTAIEQENGAVNVLVGSTPVVLGAQSRGVELRRRSQNGETTVAVCIRQDGQNIGVNTGEMGAMLRQRGGPIADSIQRLDRVAQQIIFEVNRIHSTAANASGLNSTSSTLSIGAPDRARSLNDPANSLWAGLPFTPVSGGFTITVTGPTGDQRTVRIDVDLDGRDDSGDPGFGDDTSIEDILASIDAIDGVSASFGPDGRLRIDAETGYNFSFSDDTSGLLGALGVNAFFTGSGAADINVRADLLQSPELLGVGRFIDGEFVENGAALAIAALQDQALDALGGISMRGFWSDTAQSLGVQTGAAASKAEAATIVRESLDAQRASISGVNIDEESINMLTYQRQYQGAARFISVVDEMMRTLISMV